MSAYVVHMCAGERYDPVGSLTPLGTSTLLARPWLSGLERNVPAPPSLTRLGKYRLLPKNPFKFIRTTDEQRKAINTLNGFI